MKKIIVSLCLLMFTGVCFAQQTKLDYTIAPWLDNKKAAVSLTFDDGIRGQFEIAVPLLNQYNFKATFFVTVKTLESQLGGWQLVTQADSAEHEIANHALTHPHFNAIAIDTIARELAMSNVQIEQHTTHKVFTHAYPFGEGGQATAVDTAIRAVVKKYFIGARATRNKPITYNEYGFAVTDDDYFKINSDMIADSASMAGFTKHLDENIAAGGWYVPTYHGIANGWIIVPTDVLKGHLAALEKAKDSIWIATFGAALKYHKERNCASLVVVSEKAGLLELQLTDTLADSKTWNQPLTINLKPDGRKITSIHQAGVNIPFVLSDNGIAFNAVPGKEKIVVTKDK